MVLIFMQGVPPEMTSDDPYMEYQTPNLPKGVPAVLIVNICSDDLGYVGDTLYYNTLCGLFCTTAKRPTIQQEEEALARVEYFSQHDKPKQCLIDLFDFYSLPPGTLPKPPTAEDGILPFKQHVVYKRCEQAKLPALLQQYCKEGAAPHLVAIIAHGDASHIEQWTSAQVLQGIGMLTSQKIPTKQLVLCSCEAANTDPAKGPTGLAFGLKDNNPALRIFAHATTISAAALLGGHYCFLLTFLIGLAIGQQTITKLVSVQRSLEKKRTLVEAAFDLSVILSPAGSTGAVHLNSQDLHNPLRVNGVSQDADMIGSNRGDLFQQLKKATGIDFKVIYDKYKGLCSCCHIGCFVILLSLVVAVACC